MSTAEIKFAVNQQAAEARALLSAIRDTMADDDEIAMTVESETGLIEAIAAASDRIEVLEEMMAGIDRRMERLRERKQRLTTGCETLRRAVRDGLEAAGLKKVETATATISLRRVPPSVTITDATAIPAALMRHPPPVPDKALIKEALSCGPVAGAVMSNGGTTIGIKRT
jgi:phage host-nuclease inhibitor protein Gam